MPEKKRSCPSLSPWADAAIHMKKCRVRSMIERSKCEMQLKTPNRQHTNLRRKLNPRGIDRTYLHPLWLPIMSNRLSCLKEMFDLGNAGLQHGGLAQQKAII